ncbi:protein transporter SEC24 [Cryptococcus wingfieldii CBS 7118]|uniref:Protein transporter SEC24 n=1 Tax=Cryptococcus wingfieldii CBS 7118 TaxID=1295528 RepID=A0A1E3IB71_9TREE|nr:protein transporter SEC24 [Cryptococcus wingfieldii CBS 7118]ODN85852.1 protein transporter SEC24 [Cryptococcus wingfieldii CBS 7118]
MSQPIMLPQGWEARWDPQSNAYIYIDQSTGVSQWEVPINPTFPTSHPNAASLDQTPSTSTPAPRQGRRHYPTAEIASQMYTNTAQYESQPQVGAPQALAHGGPQFITPGLEGQGQQAYGFPAGQPYGAVSPGVPGYGVDQASAQFQQMGISGGAQGQGQDYYNNNQKQLHSTSTKTINLIGLPPNIELLDAPPPPALLPPNAAITGSATVQPDSSYQRCTLNAMPTTQSLLNKSKLPLALVMTPNRSVPPNEPESEVPVIEDGVIARCRRCRAYINPFVTFIEGGNRWKCCMCGLSNEVPQLFDWNQREEKPADRWARAELNHGAVEFIAPTEYMVRAPQPPVYIFVIDVSASAIQSGMVATAARTILESLDSLPNPDNRTLVSFIAVSTSLHFFSLPPGATEASMLVVPDLSDVFLPKPVDLLVNLKESRAAVENLLGKLSDMFQDANTIGCALGSALQAALQLNGRIGGKIIALCNTLPTIGEGPLKARDDPKLLGTSKEYTLLSAGNSWYKSFAIECSKAQVAVDMFLFNSGYTDVATLSCLPRYTAGQTYLYPGFNASRQEDAIKFASEFGKVLSVPMGLEAVIRVRASRGVRMSAFHGNFFIRSTDLLALPVVPEDQNYVIELQLEDDLKPGIVVIQTAVLFTSCEGERRIRVITQAMPTTDTMSELFASADQVALTTYFANKAVERSMSHGLDSARDLVSSRLGEMLGVYKNQVTTGAGGASAQLAVPENLQLLPLLLNALVKHVGLREGSSIPPDLRSYAQCLLTTLPSQSLIPYIHAKFYSLHNMPAEAGTIAEHGVILPPALNLTSERLERHGLYLIEDGQNIFLYVGVEAVPRLVQDVFDLPSYAELPSGKSTLPLLDNPFSERINNIIHKTREMRRGPYRPGVYVVKQDAEPALRAWALSALVEDRVDRMGSYAQFLTGVKGKVSLICLGG